MDINVSVRAIEKLVDYTASGIGSTASFFFSRMVARRDAEVRLITAEGESEAQRILIEGRATSMQIIAAAQAEARSKLISPQAALQGEVTIGELIEQRVQFQEEKRQANIGSVVAQAAQELGDREVQDHEVDHDWTARFFNDVQDVSSEEMQRLWAKILAGEVERPGSTSFRTMNILRGLDGGTAAVFRTLCSARMMPQIGLGQGGFARAGNEFVLSLDGRAANNSLEEYGLSYIALNRLNEHGLIAPAYDSELHHEVLDSGLGRSPRWTSMAHGFQGRSWVLVPIDELQGDQALSLRVILLTNSGMELAKVVDIEAMPKYQGAVADFYEKKGFRMLEVDFGTSHTP